MYHVFNSTLSLVLLSVPFLMLSCAVESPQVSTLKVGFGSTVITPSEPTQMDGFARSQVSTGTHDDLHARCMVVEDADGTAVAMLTVSLVAIPRDMFPVIREGITEQTGIPSGQIILTATHTHSGPRVREASDDYREFLVKQCVASAVEAWNSRVPAQLGVGSTVVRELGRNRRQLLYGGVHPDPEVSIIKVEDASGKLLGVAFNYGCHPSGLDWRNTQFSEDWPYYAIQGIKAKYGDDVWAGYYQSCEGDINVGYSSELSAVGADMPVRSYWYMEWKGAQMSDAVNAALDSIATAGDIDIDVAFDSFEYPLRNEYPVTVEQAEKDAKDAKERLAVMEKDPRFTGTRLLDQAHVEVFSTGQRLRSAQRFYSDDWPATRTVEHRAVRLGDAVFATVPDEVFSGTGLAIKNGASCEKTFLIGITNGYRGYLPSAHEFVEGDYEVDGSAYSPEAEQVCIRSTLDMIGRVWK